jgi:hypothetical protein
VEAVVLSSQEEQIEREATMRNDADVRRQQREQAQREQSSTFHQHGQSQADEINQGRFAAIGTPNVTGTTAIPSYPAASPSWQIQLPDEPPLSAYENPALETSATFLHAEEGDPVAATPTRYETASAEGSVSDGAAGSSPSNRQSDGDC